MNSIIYHTIHLNHSLKNEKSFKIHVVSFYLIVENQIID